MREALAYILIYSMAAAFLWHFSNIVRFGTHIIQEPSLIILVSEIVLFCAILTFGVVSFVRLLRRL